MPTEKQPRWAFTTKFCAEEVSTSLLLHKGHPPAILHLMGLAFHLREGQWQNCGSDKLAPPSHTAHAEIILVGLYFLLVGQQLDSSKVLTCISRKLRVCCVLVKVGMSPMRFQQALCGNVGEKLTYSLLHQPSNALFLNT